MAEQTLSIKITADPKEAIISLNQVKRSAAELKDALRYYQDLAFGEKDIQKIKRYNQAINIIERDISRLGNVGKVGFDSIGDAIKKAGEQGNGLTKSFSALRQLAYILPGIGIAGIFNVAFQGIEKLAEGLGVFSSKITLAGNNLKNLNEVEKEANKQAGESIEKTKLLYEAATDVNLSMRERLRAAQELKNEYPELLKNFSKETIAAGGAKDAYDKLTQSIIENAKAKAAATKIGELQAKILDAEFQKQKILNARANEIKGAKTYNTGGEGDATITAADQILNSNNRAKKGLADQDKIIKDFVAQQKFLEDQIGKTNLERGAIGDKTPAGIDKLSKVQEILKQLADSLAGLANQKAIGFISEDLFDAEKLKAFNTALAELSKLGSKGAEAFAKLSVEEKKLFLSEFEKKMEREAKAANELFAPFEKQKDEPKPRYINGVPQYIGDFNKQQTDIGIAQNERMDKAKADELNSVLKETQKIMSVVGPAIDNMFDAFAKGENVIKALGDTFKGLAEDIAKAALKAEAFELIKTAIISAGGSVTGGFFGSFAKLLGFADGGVATGPKSGYPVMLHGTEAIFTGGQLKNLVNNVSARTMQGMSGRPANSNDGDRISAMMQMLSAPLVITHTVKGADLNILINRTQQQTQRNY